LRHFATIARPLTVRGHDIRPGCAATEDDSADLRYHARMHSSAVTRKRLTAWLALLAMWLVVCLPAVSQILAAHQAREPVAELCSGSAASVAQARQPGHQIATLTQCGYCDFLGAHPALSSFTAAAQSWLPLVQRAVSTPETDALVPLFAFQAGHPRDPPRSA
jgi:hypothetical protein